MANKADSRRAAAYGYVIADEQGRVQLHTFARNRQACWAAFGVRDRYIKKARRGMGFRCVPGFFREIGEANTVEMIEQRIKKEIRREIEKRISLNPDERDAIGVIEDYLNEYL